ncbi:D-sedoheptulose 7-phosphate isomerase [Fibrobacterota bacterium]
MTSGISQTIEESFTISSRTLEEFRDDPENLSVIREMAGEIAEGFSEGRKILTCGNGGSACEAMHLAEEFTGRYRAHRRALPAIALSEPAYLTCVGNDYGFERIFSRGVEAFGKPGDILVGLSTSGNSANVIRAVEAARERDMRIFLLLGKNGGKLKDKGNRELIIKAETTDRIQEVHMVCIHILIESVERILYPENYA